MKKYFEVINLQILCEFILPDHSRFDLRLGIPNRAPEVYKMGFKNLGLKPGAEKLFKKESTDTLLKMIRKARRIEDVEVLALVQPENEVLKKPIEAKRAEFK